MVAPAEVRQLVQQQGLTLVRIEPVPKPPRHEQPGRAPLGTLAFIRLNPVHYEI
jgi:hypothetical protein